MGRAFVIGSMSVRRSRIISRIPVGRFNIICRMFVARSSIICRMSVRRSKTTSTVQSGSPSANAVLSPHPRLQTFYTPFAHFISFPSAPLPPSLAPGCPSAPPASYSP